MTGQAAGPRNAGGTIELDRHAPVTRHSEHPSPAMRDADTGGGWEPGTQGPLQLSVGLRGAFIAGADGAAQAVARSPATDGDPAVDRSLRVAEQMALIGHRLAPLPADRRPRGRVERLGCHHVG